MRNEEKTGSLLIQGRAKRFTLPTQAGRLRLEGGLAAGSEGEGAAPMTHTVFADSVSVWTKREM